MEDNSLTPARQKTFEALKQINPYGAEFWSARDLQPLLGYTQWRSFENAVKKAILSCEKSGNAPDYHFARARKPVLGGKNAVQDVVDYHLSRFACYLIAQNGDPRKPEIAHAQKYFAVQTRRQEMSDTLAADRERLDLRKQASEEFRALSGAARDVGVQNKMFGIFHDAGYKGLYGGKGVEDIKHFKRIPPKDNLMDRMNTTELAANQFRMTQAREKLRQQNIQSQERAIQTHQQVGREVREAIQRIGGTLPEHIPPAEPIQLVEQRIDSASTHLELPEQDAKGLLGGHPKDDDTERP